MDMVQWRRVDCLGPRCHHDRLCEMEADGGSVREEKASDGGDRDQQAQECGAPRILPRNLWKEPACEHLDFNPRDSAQASAPIAWCLRFKPSACAETLSVLCRRDDLHVPDIPPSAPTSRPPPPGGSVRGRRLLREQRPRLCRWVLGHGRPGSSYPAGPSAQRLATGPCGAASRTGNRAGSGEVLVPVPGPAAGPAQTADHLPHTLRALWSKSRVRVTELSRKSWPSRSRLDGGVLSLQPHSSGQNKGQRRFPRQGMMPGPPFLGRAPGESPCGCWVSGHTSSGKAGTPASVGAGRLSARVSTRGPRLGLEAPVRQEDSMCWAPGGVRGAAQ